MPEFSICKKISTSYLYALFGLAAILSMGCTQTQNTINTNTSDVYVSESHNIFNIKEIENEMLIINETEQTSQELLETALEFARGGSTNQSKSLLAQVNSAELNDVAFINYSLLRSKISSSSNELTLALIELESERIQSLEKKLNEEALNDIFKERSLILMTLGRFEESIQNDNKLIDLVKSEKVKSELREKLLVKIVSQPYMRIEQCIRNSNPIIGGWCRLGIEFRNKQLTSDNPESIFLNWASQNPTHPASEFQPLSISHEKKTLANNGHIALLLPFNAEYETASKIFMDGFLDGFYKSLNLDKDHHRKIKIFDSSEKGIISAYEEALDFDAQLIVGGLRQSEAEILSALKMYEVPTIIINDPEKTISENVRNLIFFSNSQEDEIHHIIEKVWQDGKRSIVIIAPNQSWGLKSSDIFESTWIQKGGEILDKVIFDQDVRDFTVLLKQPLHIDLSEKRGLFMRRFVNSQLEVSSRRRDDIDAFILFAYPDKARQIKPALNYLFASNVPVYSSSRIYSGSKKYDLNKDLDDIQFTGMPWTSDGSLRENIEIDASLHPEYIQLYSRGFDSFSISQKFLNPNAQTKLPVFSATGLLEIHGNLIKKIPRWYQFRNGINIDLQFNPQN